MTKGRVGDERRGKRVAQPSRRVLMHVDPILARDRSLRRWHGELSDRYAGRRIEDASDDRPGADGVDRTKNDVPRWQRTAVEIDHPFDGGARLAGEIAAIPDPVVERFRPRTKRWIVPRETRRRVRAGE